MTEIISVYNIELDQTDCNGTTHWLVSARVSDMVQTIAPCYNPPGLSCPAEYGAADCSAMLSLMEDELPPDDPDHLRQYLQNWNLDWEVDE